MLKIVEPICSYRTKRNKYAPKVESAKKEYKDFPSRAHYEDLTIL